MKGRRAGCLLEELEGCGGSEAYGSALEGLDTVTEDLEAVVENRIGSGVEVWATWRLEKVGVSGNESLRGGGRQARTVWVRASVPRTPVGLWLGKSDCEREEGED